MADLPIICTLSPETIQTRRAGLLPGVIARAAEREALPAGYRLRFAVTDGILTTLAEVIDAERQCCRFLRFVVTVEPDGGPLAVEITGPAGTREFLDALFEP